MKLSSVFLFSISENIFSEQDEEKKCKNYPNADFLSYKKCDEDFIHKEMKNIFDLIPFWATGILSEVNTLSEVTTLKTETKSLFQYADGTNESPCPKPCLSTKVSNHFGIAKNIHITLFRFMVV